MRCAVCGREWNQDHDEFYWHSINSCPLSEVCISSSVVEAINAAIEAAKDEAIKTIIGDKRLNLVPVLQKLMEFLMVTANSEQPMMTEFGIGTKEKEGVLIRLWASKGQTPVERIVELKKELDAAKVDRRDRSMCKHFDVETATCLWVCKKLNLPIGDMCPCSGWEK